MTFFSSRNRQLDLLRGLAILLVLGRHLPQATPFIQAAPPLFCKYWFRIGWSGVDLFFVLSGFLISGLLFLEFQATGAVQYKRFILRRGLRIWPAFYLLLLVTCLADIKFSRVHQLVIELLFLQSYFSIGTMWAHTWTLAIEEHFYFGLGLIAFLLAKNRHRDPFRIIPLLWLFSAFACLWFRLQLPYDSLEVFKMTHVRIDSLLFGVTLSYFYHYHRRILETWTKRLWPLLATATVLFLIPVFRLDFSLEPFLTRFGLTLTYLAFGMALLLLLFVVPFSPKPSAPERILRWIGVRSYSIYLWHLPSYLLLVQPITLKLGVAHLFWWAASFYVIGALLAGHLCYEFFEKPILKWRDNHIPSPAKPIA